jgi:septal ring factor EnvC (AmiA/AmiB activator)
MKSLPAILFALAITAIIGVSMIVIGGNALFNANTVPVASSQNTADNSANTSNIAVVDTSSTSSSVDAQQVSQMQSLIAQYQQREKAYQAQLAEATNRLNQANTQLQQSNQQLDQMGQSLTSYQNLFAELQQRGILRVAPDGSITLGRSGGGDNN